MFCEDIVGTREAEVSTLTSPGLIRTVGGKTHWHQTVFFPIMAVERRLNAVLQWRNVFTRIPARRSWWNPWNRRRWESNFSQAGSNDVKVPSFFSWTGIWTGLLSVPWKHKRAFLNVWVTTSRRLWEDVAVCAPLWALLCCLQGPQELHVIWEHVNSAAWGPAGDTGVLRMAVGFPAKMSFEIIAGQQFVPVSRFLFRQTGRQPVETREVICRGFSAAAAAATWVHIHPTLTTYTDSATIPFPDGAAPG